MAEEIEKAFNQYHKDGSIWAKGRIKGKVPVGYWEWFRKDGTKMRSGYYRDGIQVGLWTTYDKCGEVYKISDMKDGKKDAQKTVIKQAE